MKLSHCLALAVITLVGIALVGVAFVAPNRATAQQAPQQPRPRGAGLMVVQNKNPAFNVRVELNNSNGIYREGDFLTATVTSGEDGYLYFLYEDAQGNVNCLFPNYLQTDNKIKKNTAFDVPPERLPGETKAIKIVIQEPFGTERVMALVSRKPLEVNNAILLAQEKKPIAFENVKLALVPVGKEKPEWAEHSVTLTTFSKQERILPKPPRRVGLFIGVGQYKYASPLLTPIPVCKADAEKMRDAMRKHGQLDKDFLLVDEQATLENIVHHLREILVEHTSVGDTVFLYWSGHGGQCLDDNGDEQDQLDEFLVPYDARTEDVESARESTLMDDAFGRILQDLDGRRLAIILDTCHSGGQAKDKEQDKEQDKGKDKDKGKGKRQVLIKGLSVGPIPRADAPSEMFDNELRRTKDVGQRDTALLVSSRADQYSYVRQENDLSVMTKFLLDVIQDHDGSLTFTEAGERVQQLVPRYMADQFPGKKQEPELFDEVSPPIRLRP